MAYTTSNDRSKQTKKALIPIFGRENVRVRHGRGTAYGWTDVDVRIPRPHDCTCRTDKSFFYPQCEACRETRETTRRVIRGACQHIDYGKYCVDDGYGSEADQVAIQIHYDDENPWVFRPAKER